MQATLIPSSEINSDLGVVNCARVSLSKKHDTFDADKDLKLLRYLAKHNHWTPFAHPSLYFNITWQSESEALYFYRNSNLAGFQYIQMDSQTDWIKGSLFGWISNSVFLPKRLKDAVLFEISLQYPHCTDAIIGLINIDPFIFSNGTYLLTEGGIEKEGKGDLIAKTLLIQTPIAIARQIRTSQVGFAYGDSYVEGESFVFNEVSRRYVSDDPEFYLVKQWRVREGTSIKQGSTGNATTDYQEELNDILFTTNYDALQTYRYYIDRSIAPEQLRFILPQSMYTEFYMTGTVKRWKQFIALRSKPDVQEETREITSLIQEALGL